MTAAPNVELQRKIEEYKARESVYRAGLLGQEEEMGHLRQMAADVLSAYGDVSKAATRGALVDPTANMEVLLLRQRIRERDSQINNLQEELEANRFDQKAPAGVALMRKCKALLTENRELGEEAREERIAELRSTLQAEQRQNEQLYQKVQESADFCKELMEENDKLQGTIARVAGKLGESSAELKALQTERAEAKKKRKMERDAKTAVVQQPILGLPSPIQGLASPIAGLASPLAGMPSPIQGLASPVAQTAAVAPPLGVSIPKPPASLMGTSPAGAPDAAPADVQKSKKEKKEKKDKSRKRKADQDEQD